MAIHITDKKECCGCTICVSICPTHALSLSKDYKGFCYPRLDKDACIDCGKCERICPIKHHSDGVQVNKAFAAWATRPNVKSTSGSIAYHVAVDFISRGGIVYGCTETAGSVSHIRVSTTEEADALCGSKYAQSDIAAVYKLIREDLKNGIRVLFIGVPCQVYAVKMHFRQNLDNLYLMDLLCHGVPSQQMLDEHLASIAKEREIKSISFRDGEEYCMKVTGNGWEKKSSFLRDAYIAGFLNSITLRESCVSCRFVGDVRYSDITIGDFWGLGSKESFDVIHPAKVSLVIPSTLKGQEIINSIEDSVEFYERPSEEAINGNYPLRVSAKRTLRYRLFSALYRFIPFDVAVRLSLLDVYSKKFFQIITRKICRRK